MSAGSYIHLDGSATAKNPYTCETRDPEHPGIHLTKSVSFVSMRSRAYISCLHGNPWFVNGTKFKDGVRISFSGLTFLNTPIRLLDAFVAVRDTVFAETKSVSLAIAVLNLPRLDLSLKNVVFQQNAGCMTIMTKEKNRKIFVNITNTVFNQNSILYTSNTPSILWLNSTENLINIQLRNCSFKKNTFKKYGLIVVVNKLGTTNISLNQFRLEENSHTNPSIEEYGSLFRILSAWVFMRLEYGFVYRTSSTFLTVSGYSAQIDISSVQVDGFVSVTPGGGVVNLVQSDSCHLSIKDSTFSNGNNNGTGGVVSIVTPNLVLTIQNSTIQNISSSKSGGAVYIRSQRNAYSQSLNRSKTFFVDLRVINSSFSYSTSRLSGGAIWLLAENLLTTVRDSSFLRNSATTYGGALFIFTSDAATISFYDDYFQENSAIGGIIYAAALHRESTLNLNITNVRFVQNKLHATLPHAYGVVYLWAQITIVNVNFKNLHFIENLAKDSSCIFLVLSQSTLNFVTLDTCIFNKNDGLIGTVNVIGGAALTCKHSIFDSNSIVTCGKAIMVLSLRNSMIFIKNTTFVNNLCAALVVEFSGTRSSLKIYDSAFVRNKYTSGTPGALGISGSSHQTSTIKAIIKTVLFQENTASMGSVMLLTNGKVNLTNCTFLNNFADFQGGQILSSASGCSSLELFILNSVFKQTIQKVSINNTKKFMATSFIRLYNSGTLYTYNTTFNWDTKSDEPLIVVSRSILSIDNSTISICPVGHDIKKTSHYFPGRPFGSDSLTLSCTACDYNFYSLQRGTARGLNVDDGFECTPCPRGADCVPAIMAKPNFWGYQISSTPPKLAFTICPFGYCKSPPVNSNKYNDCQGKRTGVMCGICSQGYTDTLWSTYCTPVEDCHDHWFWALFLALVFFMAILLVFKPPFVKYTLEKIFWFKGSCTTNIQDSHDMRSHCVDEDTEQGTTSESEQLQDKRQPFSFEEIIFYFYQIAQLLLSSTSLTEFFHTQFFAPFLGFFNFQPSLTKQGFLCPFPGLTPETKLAFKLASVFGTLVAIFFIYALNFFIRHMKGNNRPVISPYLRAGIETIFLGYVTLATVSISLIRCVFVAGEDRWFYNGNVLCYQWWQYAAYIFNGIFVIPFIFVLAWLPFKLHHDNITIPQFLLAIICPLPVLLLWMFRYVCQSAVVTVEENKNLEALKEMLLAPYRQPEDGSKRGAIYWQSVLIARRFILVLIFCVVTEPSIRLFCMTLTCVFVLFCHLLVKPFQNSSANNLESLSLLCLVILGLINLFKSVFVGLEQNIKGSLVTVFKVFQWLEIVMLGLFPALLLLLVCFAIISLFVRALFVCFRSIFKCLFRPRAQEWSSLDSLLNVCENNDDENESPATEQND